MKMADIPTSAILADVMCDVTLNPFRKITEQNEISIKF